MTKYEWEAELKKSISSLPSGEQEKVFEYYNELFQDKIECGETETQIIAGFGNPLDVSYKIRKEYEEECYVAKSQQTSNYGNGGNKASKRQDDSFRGDTKPLSMRSGEVTTGEVVSKAASIIIEVVLWCVFALAIIVGVSVIIAGVFAVIFSFFWVTESSALMLIILGGGVAAIGVGVIFLFVGKKILPFAKGNYNNKNGERTI